MEKPISILIDKYVDLDISDKILIDSLHDAAYQKKYPLQSFDSVETAVKMIGKRFRKLLIVISDSIMNSEKLLHDLNAAGIHPIFIDCIFQDSLYHYSSVIQDYTFALYHLTKRIVTEHSAPCAFIGFNPDSGPDTMRLKGFTLAMHEFKVHAGVINNEGDINECLDRTMNNIRLYRNLFCANDGIALLLIEKLTTAGLNPNEYNISGCSNFKLGKFCKPSLTTVTSELEEAGRLAIDAYSLLYKHRTLKSVHMVTKNKIIFRESTHLPNNNMGIDTDINTDRENKLVDFYGNEKISGVFTIEKMLQACNKTDLVILEGIISGKTYEQLSYDLEISVNTIKYHVKKMVSNLEVTNRSELIKRLKNFGINSIYLTESTE
jgi:DNA-binding LacI/PurR family transcriptional regulator/DNA-binding CsgD family transcriptional regulator